MTRPTLSESDRDVAIRCVRRNAPQADITMLLDALGLVSAGDRPAVGHLSAEDRGAALRRHQHRAIRGALGLGGGGAG